MEKQENSVEITESEKIYKREISKYPELSLDEQLKLGQMIAEGSDEEKEYAKKKLTESNLKLVVSFANKYINMGLPWLDLIQEGNIGLMRAVERYDYKLGYKFSTYAAHWIKRELIRAVSEQTRVIRIPVKQVDILNKVLNTQKQLTVEFSRNPSIEEIAERTEMSAQQVEEYLKFQHSLLSIDEPVGDDSESTLSEILPDDSKPSIDEEIENDFLREDLLDALNTLNERDREIIALRFGMKDGKVHTLEEVSSKMNITKERVRQIENEAFSKLRHSLHLENLKDYLQ